MSSMMARSGKVQSLLPGRRRFVLGTAALALQAGLIPSRQTLGQGALRSAGLQLCGRPFWVSGKGFPRVLHLGKPPRSPLGAWISERTGDAFIPADGRPGSSGGISCRSSVTTVDAKSGRFVRIVPVGAIGPQIAVDDRAGRIFVVGSPETRPRDASYATATVLDTQGRIAAPPRTFRLCPCGPGGAGPSLQVDGDETAGRFFVGSGRSVITFDAISGRLLNDFAGGNGTFVVDRRDGRLFVGTDSGMATIDATTGRLLNQVSVDIVYPNFLVDDRRGRVFLPTRAGMAVVDATTGSVVRTITLGWSEGRLLAEDRRMGRIFVESWTGPGGCGHAPGGPSALLGVLDAATGKVLRAMFDSCWGFRVAVDEYARRAYVSISEYSPAGEPVPRTAVLDSKDGRVLRVLEPRTSGPPPTLLSVGARTGRLYYLYTHCPSGGCTAAIKVFDPTRQRVLRTLLIPDTVPILRTDVSTTIADGARRVLVANPAAGTVTMLQVGP